MIPPILRKSDQVAIVVLRDVVADEPQSAGVYAELGAYLETNRYEEREVEKRSLDKYFAALKAGKPQIFNVYEFLASIQCIRSGWSVTGNKRRI